MGIRNFRHKALAELWSKGSQVRGIDQRQQERILRLLDRLEQAVKPEDMNFAGTKFHTLRGRTKRYTVHVNGPWCITFEFEDGDACEVDLEQYH
jgi:toxin HigB-1